MNVKLKRFSTVPLADGQSENGGKRAPRAPDGCVLTALRGDRYDGDQQDGTHGRQADGGEAVGHGAAEPGGRPDRADRLSWRWQRGETVNHGDTPKWPFLCLFLSGRMRRPTESRRLIALVSKCRRAGKPGPKASNGLI